MDVIYGPEEGRSLRGLVCACSLIVDFMHPYKST